MPVQPVSYLRPAVSLDEVVEGSLEEINPQIMKKPFLEGDKE